MSQPTPYDPAYDFVGFQTINPDRPLPADKLEAELNAIQATLDQTLANLALLQRDDTELANETVGYDQFKPGLDLGFNPPNAWATGQSYSLRDTVFVGALFYRCTVAHTSGDFAIDLAASKWVFVADFTTGGGGGGTLDGLSDVAITAPTTGHVLRHNGANWVNAALAQSDITGLVAALAALQPLDADLTAIAGLVYAQGDILYHNGSALVKLAAGVNGQFLRTNGASNNPAWADAPGAGGGINNIVEDTTPQLGGNLDLNGFTVGAATAADLVKLNALTATSTELNFVDGVTSAIQTQLNAKQALDATLTALAAYNTNGILTQTAADTFAGRTITGTANEITVTNGNGVLGNPTLALHSGVYRSGGTDVAVADGGTGRSSHTEYAVICGGTTTTAAQQSIASVGTAGQVLTSNGAGALPTFQNASGGWTLVNKATDTTRNANTTTSADPDLQFSLAANTTYAIRIVVKYRSTAAGDFKWGLTGPASPTEVYGGDLDAGQGETATFEAYPTNIPRISSATGAAVLFIELVAENGANAGTFSFNWAQNASDAGPTVVKAGSYIEYRTF